MRKLSVLLAGTLGAFGGSAEAAQCTRFVHSSVLFAVEFVGGRPSTPVTSWPILLVGITTVPSVPRTPRKYVRSDCAPIQYVCYANVADATDLFAFKVETDPDAPDGGVFLTPLYEPPPQVYYAGCTLLEEIARDDAKSQPLVLPLPR